MTTTPGPRRPLWQRLPVLREAGLALAALAVWMLLLLSPLHQTAQALVTFQTAGALPADATLLCQPSGRDGQKDRPDQTCPFQGLHGAAGLPPLAQVSGLSRRRFVLQHPVKPASRRKSRARHARQQPRAPPVPSA